MFNFDIHIQHDEFEYTSTTNIIKFDNQEYEIYFTRYPDKIYVVRNDIRGFPLLSYENHISYIPYQNDDEFEPWAFQATTAYDIDFEWLRTFIFDLIKFDDYIKQYIDTLPKL